VKGRGGLERCRTNTKVFGRGLKERVLLDLGLFAGTEGSGRGLLARSCFSFGRLVIETRSAMLFDRIEHCASEL